MNGTDRLRRDIEVRDVHEETMTREKNVRRWNVLLLAAVALCLAPTHLFAGGSRESRERSTLTVVENGSDAVVSTYTSSVRRGHGVTEIVIATHTSLWDAVFESRRAIVMVGDSVREAWGGPVTDPAVVGDARTLVGRSGATDYEVRTGHGVDVFLSDPAYARGAGVSFSDRLDGHFILRRSEIVVRIDDTARAGGFQVPVRIFTATTDGEWERLDVTIPTDFFPGERALFAEHAAGYSYEEAALGALGGLLDHDAARFREVVRRRFGHELDAPFWTAFADAGDSYKDSLVAALSRHFATRVESRTVNGEAVELPYMDLTAETFDRLYGDGGSIYVTAYLSYLFERGRPVLSALFAEELPATAPYDPAEYRAVNATEGEVLARNALRYLTGAVEYTPYPAGLPTSTGARGVFGPYRSEIDGWTDGGVAGRSRESNYRSAEAQWRAAEYRTPGVVEEVASTHMLSGDRRSHRLHLFGTTVDRDNRLRRDVFASGPSRSLPAATSPGRVASIPDSCPTIPVRRA